MHIKQPVYIIIFSFSVIKCFYVAGCFFCLSCDCVVWYTIKIEWTQLNRKCGCFLFSPKLNTIRSTHITLVIVVFVLCTALHSFLKWFLTKILDLMKLSLPGWTQQYNSMFEFLLPQEIVNFHHAIVSEMRRRQNLFFFILLKLFTKCVNFTFVPPEIYRKQHRMVMDALLPVM